MEDSKQLQMFTIPLSSLGILLNCLLLAFAIRHKVASRSATALVRSQATLDALVLATNIAFVQLQAVPKPTSNEPTDAGWFVYCIFGNESTILMWYLIDCSIYNTLAFSIERCLCICCHFWWQRHKRAALRIFYIVIFLIGLVIYVPLDLLAVWPRLMAVKDSSITNASSELSVVCDNREFVPAALLQGLSVGSSSITVFIPTLCMLACYAAIFIHLRRSAAMSASSNKSEAASKRFTIIVGLTVVAFIVCNMPDCVNYTMWNPGVGGALPDVVAIFAFPFMSAINSLVNPIIYLVFHRQFTRFVFCPLAGSSSDSSGTGKAEGQVSGSVAVTHT